MSVTVHDNGNGCGIEVLGLLGDPSEQAELLDALGRHAGRRCEVTFYDARVLSGDVVERLAALAQGGGDVKIRVYHPFLVHFLVRLGLPVVAVHGRSECAGAPRFDALALGGSADSLDKILHLVGNLPLSDAAVFIVQHVAEDKENLLDRLLRVRTDYAVVMPWHLMPVERGTIYVAPPGHHMKVAHGLVYLTQDKIVQFARPSIDALFRSVAGEYGERAIAVLLCGYGKDGVAALGELKERGATVLVERSEECGARDLVEAAKASGSYDHVFGVVEMACFLASAVAGRTATPDARLIDLLFKAVSERYGYDYSSYQRGSVERRLDKMMHMQGMPDFFALQRGVLSDAEIFEQLFLELSINVTAFFRHPEQYRFLREEVLPYLDSFPHIKIWSAGCSSGEEVYSLAILLDELGMLEKTQIFATDINPYVLDEARTGLFGASEVEQGRLNYRESGGAGNLDRYWSKHGSYLKIDPRLRKNMLFYNHSLAYDGVFNEFQLIVCRNVVIYFNPDLQRRVMELFDHSLHQDGFLMLGPSESVSIGDGGRYFKPHARNEKVFRKH